jgi:hypothetical protein
MKRRFFDVVEKIVPSYKIKQLRLIQAWIEIHKEELNADWQLCQNGEKPYKIEPLK